MRLIKKPGEMVQACPGTMPPNMPVGTLVRGAGGAWMQRTKRRTAGKKWKPIEKQYLPKELLLELVLMGEQP